MKRTDYKGFIRYELKDSKNKRRKGRYGFFSLVPDHTEPASFFSVGIIIACRCFSNESHKTSDLVSNSMSVCIRTSNNIAVIRFVILNHGYLYH